MRRRPLCEGFGKRKDTDLELNNNDLVKLPLYYSDIDKYLFRIDSDSEDTGVKADQIGCSRATRGELSDGLCFTSSCLLSLNQPSMHPFTLRRAQHTHLNSLNISLHSTVKERGLINHAGNEQLI